MLVSKSSRVSLYRWILLLGWSIFMYSKFLDWISREPEMRPSVEDVVPNIVHFLRFGTKPLTFIDAVCILAALKNQKPDELLVHSDQKVFDGGKYWHVVTGHPSAVGVVKVKYFPQPDTIYGMRFSEERFYKWNAKFTLYHKGDVARLRILRRYGGIFLDNDSYIVKSLNEFRHYEMTLGWEQGGGISNQVIIAAKNATFLRVWSESFQDYRADRWFWNGGELPTILLQRRPSLIHRVETKLAEWKNTTNMIYYERSESWRTHFAIHLLIGRNNDHIRWRDLSKTATYPVEFNETNILNYEANIKYMALDVYPFPAEKHHLMKNPSV